MARLGNRLTLRAALALALLSGALFAVFSVAARFLRQDRAELVERFAGERLSQVDEAAREIGFHLDDVAAALRFTGSVLGAADTASDLSLQLRAILAADKQYRLVRVYSPDGATMISVGEGLPVAGAQNGSGGAGGTLGSGLADARAVEAALDETARGALKLLPGQLVTSPALTITSGCWSRVYATPFSRVAGGPVDGAIVVLVEMQRLFDKVHLIASVGDVRTLLLGGEGEPTAASDLALAGAVARAEATPSSYPEFSSLITRMRLSERGTLTLDRPRAAALGLGDEEVVAAFSMVRGEGAGRWSIATLSSTEALRRHEQALVQRLSLVVLVVALLLLGFSGFLVVASRREVALRERLRHADQLRHLHEKTEKILDNVPTGVMSLADDGRISALNRALRERCPEGAIGGELGAAFPEAPTVVVARLRSLVAAARSSGRVRSLFGQRLALFGEEGQYSLHAVPLETRFADARVLLVVEDLSEVRALEGQLLRAEKLATIGVLSAGIAHEIGTPLGVVRGRAEYILGKLGAEHPQASGLSVIVDQIDRVSRTIRQLLDFARVKPASVRSVEVAPVARAVVELLRFEAERRKVSIASDDKACPSASVAADPDQLQQVLLNLCMNALDACAPGGHVAIVLRPAAAVAGVAAVEQAGWSRLRIEVVDDGCGIPEALRLQVFDPFFTTKKRGQGTGLGLTMSAEIVRDHGAEIELESEPGKGTRVILLWPIEPRDEAAGDGAERAPKEKMNLNSVSGSSAASDAGTEGNQNMDSVSVSDAPGVAAAERGGRRGVG